MTSLKQISKPITNPDFHRVDIRKHSEPKFENLIRCSLRPILNILKFSPSEMSKRKNYIENAMITCLK